MVVFKYHQKKAPSQEMLQKSIRYSVARHIFSNKFASAEYINSSLPIPTMFLWVVITSNCTSVL